MASQYGQNRGYQEAKSENTANTNANKIDRACEGFSGSEFVRCSLEVQKSTDEADSTQKDLEAQRQVAWWTFWLMWIGVASLGATGVGLYYLAANLSVMQGQTDLAREAMVAQTRAWLNFKSVELKAMHITKPHITVEVVFTVENSGFSPALNVVVNQQLVGDFSEAFTALETRRNDPAQKVTQQGVVIFKDTPFPFHHTFRMDRKKIRIVEAFIGPGIWIKAIIEYDIPGSVKHHHTSAQWMILAKGPGQARMAWAPLPWDKNTGSVAPNEFEMAPVGEILAS